MCRLRMIFVFANSLKEFLTSLINFSPFALLINNKEVPIFCVTDFSIEDEQGILTKML